MSHRALNQQQFHQQQPLFDPGPREFQPKPQTFTMLHYTEDPSFEIQPGRRPHRVGQEGARLFGTRHPASWRFWTKERPYAARIQVSGATREDTTATSFSDETPLTSSGIQKAQVLGVHPSRIFRGPWDLGEQKSADIFHDRRQGPRQKKLPLPEWQPQPHPPRIAAQMREAS